MSAGAKNSTERSRDLRARRRDLGLRELRAWVSKEHESTAKEIMKSFEQAALAKSIEDRNKINEGNVKRAIERWHNWLDSQEAPKLKPLSTRKQRLYAYRISRAADIPMPNDLIFSDYYLLDDWIKAAIKDHNQKQQVEQFIAEMKSQNQSIT